MGSTADSSFGGLLRSFRHGAGLTLEALSERSGVTGRAISNMERGHSRSPQRRTLVLLADALELTGTERAALVEAAAGRGNVAGSGRGWCEPPRGLSDFTGRTGELAWLAALDSSRDTDTGSGAVAAVAVVMGQPGLGKTSLAVRFATEAKTAERFPDGVFFVALRGLDDQPMSAAEALWRLLRALDVPEYRIPEEVDDRAGLYRAELRDRRCLVVLDNALDEAQVRPLIPSDGPSMVVITSRRALSGLAGVDRLEPAGLSRTEATELLRGIATTSSDDPAASGIGELARLCDYLPLALRIAGTRLASRPEWTAQHLVGRLAVEEQRLRTLTVGDLAVGAAFSLSYQQLSRTSQRMFRRLSLIPGRDMGADLGAVLMECPVFEAEESMDELVELGLLAPGATGRYQFHDLLRLFARERLDADEPSAELDTARDRLVTSLLATTTLAARFFGSADTNPLTAATVVTLGTLAEGLAWLELESTNWQGALYLAAADGRHRLVIDTMEPLQWVYDPSAPWGQWDELYALSVDSARAISDQHAEAVHLYHLAVIFDGIVGDNDELIRVADLLTALADTLDDPGLQGRALVARAAEARWAGDYAEAAVRAEAATELLRGRDWPEYCQAINELSHGMFATGQHQAAITRLQLVLDVLAAHAAELSQGFIDGQSYRTYAEIGINHARLGQWAEMLAAFERGASICERIGYIGHQGRLLRHAARAQSQLGRTQEAAVTSSTAIRLLLATGHEEIAEQARQEMLAV